MRRTLSLVLLARPVAAPARRTLTASALRSTWQDRIQRKLWGANAPPPPSREQQPTIVRAPADTTGYVEAIDARGLRVVGLEPELDEWNVPAFITNTLTNPQYLPLAIHRALIEVHTRALHNRASEVIPYTGPEPYTSQVTLRLSADGQSVELLYPSASVEAAILRGEGAGGEVRGYEEAEVYPPLVGGGDEDGVQLQEGWQQVPLARELLFPFMRRVVQVTGRRVPDKVVTGVKCAQDLLTYFITPPKPLKLAEVLREGPLVGIPNVKVYESKVRPWDKERRIGRERPLEKAVEFRYPFEGKAS